MSYHPECESGLVEDDVCPYCGNESYQYTGKTEVGSGIANEYSIEIVKCDKCGREFRAIFIVDYTHFGNAKCEEDEE